MLVRALFVILIALAVPSAFAAGIDYSAVKKSVVSYCKKEPNDQLRMSCLVDSAFFLKEFENAFGGGERELITICANLTASTRDKGERMYHLMRCVAEQHVLEQAHPHPKYARIMLRKKEFRPYWVSRCSEDKNQITECVKNHEAALLGFWQFYLSIMDEPEDSTLFARIDSCIGRDIRKVRFSEVRTCIGY